MTNPYHKAYAGVEKNSEARNKNDFYPTAPIATYSLTQTEGFQRVLQEGWEVWEPAAGKGHISAELERLGVPVISTDLYAYENPLVPIETGIDFLKQRRTVNAVVTNPPYHLELPELFVRHSLDLGARYVAVFCRLTWMESMRRYDFFTEHPPASVSVFSGRVQCDEERFDAETGGIGGMIAYAWYEWYDWHAGDTKLGWINTKQMAVKRRSETHGIF